MRPPETWIVSDTHFGHNKLVEFGARPTDFTEKIIKQCQRLIMPQGLVIHLGDVIMGKAGGGNLKAIMEQLPGTWILVKGNHDKESDNWYRHNGFTFSCDSLVYRSVLFTHKPAPVLPEGAVINVHGHYHNFPRKHWELPVLPFHRLFTLEYTNYAPMLFNKFTTMKEPLSGKEAGPLPGHVHHPD